MREHDEVLRRQIQVYMSSVLGRGYCAGVSSSRHLGWPFGGPRAGGGGGQRRHLGTARHADIDTSSVEPCGVQNTSTAAAHAYE